MGGDRETAMEPSRQLLTARVEVAAGAVAALAAAVIMSTVRLLAVALVVLIVLASHRAGKQEQQHARCCQLVRAECHPLSRQGAVKATTKTKWGATAGFSMAMWGALVGCDSK